MEGNGSRLVIAGGLFAVSIASAALATEPGYMPWAAAAFVSWAVGGVFLVYARRPGNHGKLAGAFVAFTVAAGMCALAGLFGNLGLGVIGAMVLLVGLSLLCGSSSSDP